MKKKEKTAVTFDEVVAGIRRAAIDPAVVEEAARRVWARLAEPGPAAIPATTEEIRSIRGCADFQALVPAYLGKTLSPERSLLLEDHVGECLACRHALRAARPDAVRASQPSLTSAANRRPMFRWAVAAVAVLALGVGVMVVGPGGFYRAAGAGAVIQGVDGALYRVSDQGGAALSPGQQIRQDEEVRTANASTAMLRLMDGSSIEMSERADLWVTKGWRGATIHLERGKIIVQAAPQHSGSLYVATRDCRVSVKRTTFQVSQGTKGARVSVIQGLVEVEQGRHSQFLHAGDQMSTDASLDRVPVQDEVAWSQNAGQYLALLGELTGLQRQLEAIPGPGLRYSSKLVDLAPEHTVLYLAIPNIGSALGQANRIFQERIQESEVLRQWWEKQQVSGGAQLSELIPRIETFSDYLGDEVVLAVPVDSSGELRAPLILAEVRRPDLPQFLDNQFREINGATGGPALRLVKNPSALPLSQGKQPDTLVLVKDGFLAVTADVQQFRNAAALIEQSGSGRFAATPFYSAIQQAYQSGAAWLFCVDMEQIVAHSVHQGEGYNVLADSRSGLGDVKYLVVERKDQGGQTENRATLTFAQERRGIASWLAAPSPMGTLDFVSPEASVAASFVVKNPRTLIDEFLSLVQSGDPGFGPGLADFESKSGVSVAEDLAAPLGGEVTFALDGPVLPDPSWKVALEVDDPGRLESAIETMVNSFNQQTAGGGGRLELVRAESGGRTFYTLRGYDRPPAGGPPPAKPFEVDYTYVDGYLVAAPNQDLLRRAIQNRETGYSLSRSADFRSRLPRDGYANFSAMIYHNLGAVLGPIIDRLKSSSALTPAQRQSIEVLTANNAPSVVCVYGEPNQIVAASTGGLFGLDALTGVGGLAQLPQLMGLAMEQAQKGQTQKP